MTAQIADTFLFKGEPYSLIGMSGGALTEPEQFGMEPEMLHTACYRGFYATYELLGDALYLRSLTLREKNGNYRPIRGIKPVKEDCKATYQGLSVVVAFTGKIRLAKDFIRELYIHMGYQKPTAFKTVLDVTLEAGRVVEIKDRSQEVEAKRGAFKKHYESVNMLQAIDEAFSLDMDLEYSCFPCPLLPLFEGGEDMSHPDFSAFAEFVNVLMQEQHICGAAVSVKQGDATIYEGCFGLRDLESQAQVTPDTIFGLASVSKSFAALAIMQLCDAGKVYPDAPVTTYLPEFKIRGLPDIDSVRVHHLLSHSTGLPPFRRRQGEFSELSQHLEYIATAEYELLGQPGEYFSYCNDSFVMLGAVVERVTGKTFKDYIRKNIFEPLGMTRSGYTPVEIAKYGADVTTLYSYNHELGKHEPQSWPNLGSYHVSGGIVASLRDLSTYASLYTQGGVVQGRKIVSDHAIRRLRQPVVEALLPSHYCYGLQATFGPKGLTLVSHGGGLPGVSSHFGFVPEKGISVVVLSNVSGVPAKAIWMAAVHSALGLPIEAEEVAKSTYVAPRTHLERFLGTYASLESGDLRIYFDQGTLMSEQRGVVVPLWARDDVHLVGRLHGQEMVLRFFFTEDGYVWAVLAGSRMLRRSVKG
ncbi:MAG: Penicillin-binding protein 4* [Firmicutes bacterium]|nr:Penicillin-binding protein 4* [candidate division NPL-UPA2 bacterium]